MSFFYSTNPSIIPITPMLRRSPYPVDSSQRSASTKRKVRTATRALRRSACHVNCVICFRFHREQVNNRVTHYYLLFCRYFISFSKRKVLESKQRCLFCVILTENKLVSGPSYFLYTQIQYQ